VYGDSGDQLGSSVAAVGDIDNDGEADVAFGGHGAFVVRAQDTTDAVDFSSPVYAYKAVPPSGTGYDASVVSGAGDLNGDALPDLLIGFPTASGGAGDSYALLSQEGKDQPSAPINLAALSGGQGARLAGASGDQSGSGLDGVDGAGDGHPGFVVGSPGASSNSRSSSGSVLLHRDSALTGSTATHGDDTKHVCHGGPNTPYHYDKGDNLPWCRPTKGDRREVTKDAITGGYKGHAKPYRQYLGRPATGGNVRKSFRKWSLRINAGNKSQIYDSNHERMGWLKQRSGKFKWTLYADDGTTELINTTSSSQDRVTLEGTPCMSDQNLQHSYAMFVIRGTAPLEGLRFLV
jgi:hypothetical protein